MQKVESFPIGTSRNAKGKLEELIASGKKIISFSLAEIPKSNGSYDLVVVYEE